MLRVVDSPGVKIAVSPGYNYIFSKVTGQFARWGKTKEDDPLFAPGNEILDLEISYGGDCLGKCPMCYKENGAPADTTKNMTFEEFKTIFDKMPKMLTQIAFGIMNIETNPDFFDMMRYARANGVVPNYTCHGLDMTPEIAAETVEVCGATAVSVYVKEKSYDTIKMLTDATAKKKVLVRQLPISCVERKTPNEPSSSVQTPDTESSGAQHGHW